MSFSSRMNSGESGGKLLCTQGQSEPVLPKHRRAQRDLPRETSERRGNQAAHLQVLASVSACFCQKRKQVSFTTHRAEISAEYSAEAALWLTPPKGATWPRCWAFGWCSQGCGTRGQSFWAIRGVSLPADRNSPVWFQGLSVHTPLLTWSCCCKGQKIQLACLLKSRAIAKDCHYGSTFSLENTEGIATSWTNPGLSAEINDLKEWYFPNVRYKN